MSVDDIKAYKAKREQLLSELKRFHDYVSTFAGECSVTQLKLRLGKAEEIWHHFDNVQTQLEYRDEACSEANAHVRKLFEDEYFQTIELAHSLIETYVAKPLDNHVTALQPSFTDHSNIKRETSDKYKAYSKFSYIKKHEPKSYSNVTTNIAYSCAFCKGAHYIQNCFNFKKLSSKDKYAKLKELKICSNCLRLGHTKIECRSSSCKICGKRHNTLLHVNDDRTRDTEMNANVTDVFNAATSSSSTQAACSTFLDSSISLFANKENSQKLVLLSTAIILILDSSGNYVKARALLDVGSQSNFMTKDLFKKLNLQGVSINLPVLGINKSVSYISIKSDTTIKSVFNNYNKFLSFLVIDKITQKIPSTSFNVTNVKIPDHVSLADHSFNKSANIDILLGVEIFWDLLLSRQIKIDNLTLQETKLGWVLGGLINTNLVQSNRALNATICNLSMPDPNESLKFDLERFWEVEECPSDKKLYNREELLCETIFSNTHTRKFDGRFVVQLPMDDTVDNSLGESLENALRRFNSLERRFARDNNFKMQYEQFMTEYELLGHMCKLGPEELNSNIPYYYLPHHGISKDSITTKLRVVFDGSCKTSNGRSLNDILLGGPNLQDDLFSILTRFRKHKFVVTSDIEKMFRQVEIAPEHQHLQRLIWRPSPSDDFTHFKLSTVTYGTKPASFLSVRAIHELAYNYKHDYPKACDVLLRDLYMDDLLTGDDSLEGIITLATEISNILSSGCFTLRKWVSNDKRILANLPSQGNLPQYYITDESSIKILGMLWNAESDVLQYKLNLNQVDMTITKRFILSTVSKIFDPLGILTPVTVRLKMLLQRLWQIHSDWDEPVPKNILSEWIGFVNQMGCITELNIPRQLLLQDYIQGELHGFSDASEVAYGACLYVKSINKDNETSVRLICSKSRVAPLKKLTIPRLELCACLLLSKLATKTIEALQLDLHAVYYWCDSTIALSWIQSSASNWQIFVSNRVTQIQSLSKSSQWRHVRSQDNPADLISRGIEPSKLADCALWWSGPTWLRQNIDYWPSLINLEIPEELPEKRKSKITCLVENPELNSLFCRYSSFTRLVRVVAYCLRFKRNCEVKLDARNTDYLSASELEFSIFTLIKLAQIQSFANELRCLRQSKQILSSSRLISLNPFLDNNGVIRVGGRIRNAEVTYNQKFPMLLPHKHPFTRLIIIHEHLRHFHSGPQLTLASVRQRFWPLKGLSEVKRYLHTCITCFKVSPTITNPLMGDLPDVRVKISRPFTNTGVDYAGPFLIKDGVTRSRKTIKCYLCIFVCLSTKAVHLELAGNLTTEAFLNALKRFISRRGICKIIMSDNGTNFIGANRELKSDLEGLLRFHTDPNVMRFLSENSIDWKFIPARGPNFGGLWEAAVKSAKNHLKRILNTTNFNFEQLSTVITQVEAILNSRPLIPLSDSPNDLQALTPGHFLIFDSLSAIPQEDLTQINTNRLSSYKHMTQILQHFWRRWSREYLVTLQQRSKWRNPSTKSPQVGDLALVKDENNPPMKWPLSRVTALHPGNDGIVRVVTVKIGASEVRRPVRRLCFLPIDIEN